MSPFRPRPRRNAIQETLVLAEHQAPQAWELPRLTELARHALPSLVEGTFLPLTVFYVFLWTTGVWGALIGALLWSYAALIRRKLRREPMPGVLIIGASYFTIRTISALATGSVFIYFVQPTLGRAALAIVFLGSALISKPMAQKIASDFLPIPEEMLERPVVRRFFVRVSVLWSLVFTVDAAITLWLLLTQDVAVYVAAKTALGISLKSLGIAASVLWFRRCMKRHSLLPAHTA